jgi:4-hydroxy-tetrahydrodipicolinate synthase
MSNFKLKGTYTALITPFNDDLTVDFASLEKIVEYQISSNIDGLVLLGSTAEAMTLTMKEKFAIIIKVQEQVNGRIPLIVGTGSNDTQATIEFTTLAKEHNFDAAMLVTPYYNKPSQDGLLHHYLSIAEAVDIPQIIYNVPGRTGTNILPETVVYLSQQSDRFIGIKESSGDIEQIMRIIRDVRDGFVVLSGDDALAVPTVFMGGEGLISVLSNYAPKLVKECVNYALNKEYDKALDTHYDLLDLMQLNFIETNPVPVKAFAKSLGLITTDAVRLPLIPLSDKSKSIIATAVSEFRSKL